MTQINIRMTEDQLVRLAELASRMICVPELDDDPTNLWLEFRLLLLGNAEGVSPELEQRFSGALRSTAETIELEMAYHGPSFKPEPPGGAQDG